MSFKITDWNLNPNRNWYINISDSGSSILVKAYTTQANAEADSGLVASGSIDYGTNVPVILEMDEDGTPDISLFNDSLEYHISVSGVSGDSSKTYHVAPFIDIDEVNNDIYKSTSLIKARASFEIKSHINSKKKRTLNLANSFQDISVGEVLQIQSDRFGDTVLTNVDSVTITGSINSLTSVIETVEYTEVSYND